MKEIFVKSQAEFDALPKSFAEYTRIIIQSPADVWLQVAGQIENRHVVAWGSSHVVAWGSSHVVAWGSSHVVARGSSHVVARESSHVVAWGSSHVVARGSVSISCQSDYADLVLFGFAVAVMVKKAASCLKKSKTCAVIEPVSPKGNGGWLESQAVECEQGSVILFKRVSLEFKTQEGTSNETHWAVGCKIEHSNWEPKKEECNGGKFHACSRPFFCDEFRSNIGDVYIAIQIPVVDLYAWPNPQYPHKIAFRTGKVLYKCDRYGKEIK